MSASTPPPPAASVADAPTIWIAPTPAGHLPAASGDRTRFVLRARTPIGATIDLMARLGTAITLAALLVVTATALGVVDDRPMPTGAATAGR